LFRVPRTREYDSATLAFRYTKSRPKFWQGTVDKVWENAVKRSRDGIVRDPNTNEILTWDKFKQRRGQWDMGHPKDK